MNIASLSASLSPPLDGVLTEQLLSEYQSVENRYVVADWESATLDAGQLAEASARILYHQDSGNLDRARAVNECVSYVLDLDRSGLPAKQPNAHSFPDRKAAQELARVIRMAYGFRSRRGAVHISPDYTANQLDSQLVVACSRWVVCEVVRIFAGLTPTETAKVVQAIVRMEVPSIGTYGTRRLVQRTNLTAQEEILLLLYDAGEDGAAQAAITRDAAVSPSSVSKGLAALRSPAKRQVILLGSTCRITDLGIKRVVESVLPKLQ